ncbi:MAG TPA: alpha/beta hydrolase-fold protein [Pyrinomonadaceae bacterium]
MTFELQSTACDASNDSPPLPATESAPAGYFRKYRKFRSKFLDRERDVIVYLPPRYGVERKRRYPVLYFNDGQNLFDGATSYVPGRDWRFHLTADSLINSGAIEPLIIVGIYNTGTHRMDEYTPTRDRGVNAGGQADLYGRLIVEELKPLIDARHRTLKDLANTGLGGSSLGGLVSIYLGLKYPQVFGKLALVSPSVWWDKRRIIRMVRSLKQKPELRIWLDTGMKEGARTLRNTALMRDALIARGWVLNEDLMYLEVEGADHSETAWANRVADVLKYLFPQS